MPTHSDYTVGWISALPLELAASMAMLDGDPHPQLPSRSYSDQNIYTLGNIGGHNVVMACLPAGRTGIGYAAIVAEQMKSSFNSIRFGLMVGIGGGVPSNGHDIRLGDVVVSKPSGQFGGVVQYDFGKTVTGGKFERTGSLNAPPLVLLNAVNALIARHELRRSSKFTDILSSVLPDLSHEFARPTEEDRLFEAEYDHAGGDTCANCNPTRIVPRSPPKRDTPFVHHGTIGCANRVMKDGVSREILREDYKILCVEMEAAGLMNDFPCLVIRGICDYADTHKNHRWQRYAATVAAAYAKELLSIIPPAQVAETPTVGTSYFPIQFL
jgi:nucleoside phosphorylase